ncbi:MAG TPA: hypothetical protein PKO06_21045 [Candidatus Ozemobacteraceae bacterium]|nr:hypothetical protein [Candidatus Ozemobacteraceae bacterium]
MQAEKDHKTAIRAANGIRFEVAAGAGLGSRTDHLIPTDVTDNRSFCPVKMTSAIDAAQQIESICQIQSSFYRNVRDEKYQGKNEGEWQQKQAKNESNIYFLAKQKVEIRVHIPVVQFDVILNDSRQQDQGNEREGNPNGKSGSGPSGGMNGAGRNDQLEEKTKIVADGRELEILKGLPFE